MRDAELHLSRWVDDRGSGVKIASVPKRAVGLMRGIDSYLG